MDYGLLTHPQSISDQSEADEAVEHEVKLLEAREDAPVALEAAKQALDLVAPLVHLAVVLPGLNAGAKRWHYWDVAQVESQLASNSRPCGASPACPGDSENVMAVRASAATI